MLNIAIDAMGGDLGPRVAFRACKAYLKNESSIRLILPLEDEYHPLAKKKLARFADRVEIIGCTSHVKMHDSLRTALREHSNSTMMTSLQLHKSGDANGVLSIGNTAALLMMSKRVLGTLNGIERPSLATQLPTKDKPLLMMDLGANICVNSEQLLQLAYLAVAWYRAGGVESPALSLLNIGSEPGKGPDTIKAAGELLTHRLEGLYAGFVEGDRLFDGHLDAVICDGYSGNIALKTTEGLIEWLLDMMSAELRHSKALWWFLPFWKATMRRIDRQMSPARHGGAMLLGVSGHVAKTHGKSDERTFRYALEYLVRQVRERDYHELESEYNRLTAGFVDEL
jgi:glycerol-3-phosphate acyltransferase PlsX